MADGGRQAASPWQEYGLALLFQLVFPLVPLGIEAILKGNVSEPILTMAAAMYALSIGVASRQRLVFGMTIFIAFVEAVAFGVSSKSGEAPPGDAWSLTAIGLVSIAYAAERYGIHVVKRAPFWEF